MDLDRESVEKHYDNFSKKYLADIDARIEAQGLPPAETYLEQVKRRLPLLAKDYLIREANKRAALEAANDDNTSTGDAQPSSSNSEATCSSAESVMSEQTASNSSGIFEKGKDFKKKEHCIHFSGKQV
ncbi:hypothetical protein GCK72_022802 [Caenorhabditis remanei]|uniref:Uncharacterized protein n=1 Tax=Caenorhabditis remanei TaxID=31234 RepID=A0A6A5FV55_CAERE|nr:hypothetical protein GCK72_022802 [Caenorhabditis remanei]KAF1746349.1 hypothetical protein GCK72_022802 [Caenorhabditis remanei]